MKKKLMSVVALALCLILLCPATLAQASGYVLGKTTRELLTQTFLSGKRMTSEVKLGLELDGAALGLTEEESAQMQSVLEILNQMTITGGVVKLDDGLRLELAGKIASEAGDATVGMDAAAQLSLDGVSLESDVIAGRRVSVQWETLLSLCGADAEMISTFTEVKEVLRTADMAQVEQEIAVAIAELTETIQPIIELAGQMAQPYVAIIEDAILALPMELRENLNEEGYPPTATEIRLDVTVKDIGDLLTKLCDEAAQDDALKRVGDLLLAEAGADVTTAELIDALRAQAAQMTDTTMPIVFFLGFDEEKTPIYLEVAIVEPTTEENVYVGIFCYENEEKGSVIELYFGGFDADDELTVYFSIDGNVLRDENDPNARDMALDIGMGVNGGAALNFWMTDLVVPKEDSEQPSYDLAYEYGMQLKDGEETTWMVANTEGSVGMTAAGGETSTMTATVDMNTDGMESSMGSSATMLLEPTADGNIAGAYSVSGSIPVAGVKNLALEMTIASEDYDPSVSASLEAVVLESLSQEEIEALLTDAYETLVYKKAIQLMTVLPESVLKMLFE